MFVAGLVDAFSASASQFLSALQISTFSDRVVLRSLRSYNRTLLNVTPLLVQVASQIACARAVGTASIVSDIMKVAFGWEEAKLHDYPNDYVDVVTDRCCFIWGYFVASAKLPQQVMKNTWKNLVQACYLSMLEGFARVPCCSSEGRALMKLDLACLMQESHPRALASA
jgi:fucose 4-O-acetylase-like acetyltransferase